MMTVCNVLEIGDAENLASEVSNVYLTFKLSQRQALRLVHRLLVLTCLQDVQKHRVIEHFFFLIS
jgi:hypothetical protein